MSNFSKLKNFNRTINSFLVSKGEKFTTKLEKPEKELTAEMLIG